MAGESPPSFSESIEVSEAVLPPGYDSGPSPLAAKPQLVERVFTLEANKRTWAFLKVRSRGGKTTSIPRFLQGEPITGTVELSLDKTEHIQAVTIEVRGETLAVGQDSIPFFSRETTLWSTSMGAPGTEKPGNGSPKLKGEYAWPFSLSLPDTVMASAVEKGPTAEYPLPPSFTERASPCYLEYKVIVTFRRGRLRIDNVLSTTIAYVPCIRPSAPSALRQLAYRENTPLMGPEVDPEGWEVLGTKSVVGTVFDSRSAEVACVFALAKPLSYTRGTSIPFTLTLSCPDRQALDLFAGRGSLSIFLERSLRMGVDTTDGNKTARSDRVFPANVGKGIYWPSPDDDAGSMTRKLHGEIALISDLKPSFVFPRISLTYHVIFELGAPGFTFTSEDERRNATFSREVEIATVLASGPVPRSKAPASHAAEQKGSYSVTIGMLTGANQRFLHHHAFS